MPVYAIVAIVVGCIGFLMLVGAWLFYARRRHTDKLKNLEDWINTGDGN
jgi:nitrate reductase gamma subunit